MRVRRLLLAAACAALAAPALSAEFAYDPDVERFGHAVATPLGRRDSLRKVAEYCAQNFPEIGWNAYAAFGHWVRRHAAFLQLSLVMRQALSAAADKEQSQDGARWSDLADTGVDKSADAIGAGLVQGISGLASPEERKRACTDDIAGAEALKLDLDNAEPAVAKYLRDIAGKFRIKLPPPGSAGTAAAGARTDARALIGGWRTEKIRYYLADGRSGEDDAQCTLTFSEKSMVSDCWVSGRQVRVVSSYRVPEPGRYESQVTENATYPDMVGARDITAFRVEGGKLVTSSFLPTLNADPMRPIEIEAVLAPGVLSGRRQ
jgi:hypothetical protein